jgi:hypothetical protein
VIGRVACAVGIAALVAWIYAPVRHHEYLDYDDLPLLVWNPDIEPGSLGQAVAIAFAKPQMSGWVPIATLSHQLDRALWGRNAGWPLIENAALHALGAVLLLLALERLTGRLGASAFVAAVHAVHPLHVESVAWAIERKDVLSGACFSGLLWLHARYAEQPSRAGRYYAVLACLALGLLSKPMLVTAPFVLLLLDFWPLRRLDGRAVREKAPMLAMALGVSLVTWQAQRASGAFSFGTAVPLRGRVENALDAIVAYLLDAFWPTRLAAYYPHPGTSLGPLHVAACAALIAAATAGAWRLRARAPWLITGWLWYLGMLVPVVGLVQVGLQARADRYTYLPLIGISIALAFSLDAWARTAARRRSAAAAGVAAVAGLAVAAAPQLAFWRDSRTLYARMRDVHPRAAFPELRLGMVEAIDGDLDAAAPHLERALALDPVMGRNAAGQLADLARFQAQQGRAGDARRTAQWALGFAERTDQPDRALDLRLLLRALAQ